MRVRAKLILRNDKMLAARERLGLTQLALASVADVPGDFIGKLEAFDYQTAKDMQRVRRVADALELEPDDVLPEELRGQRIESTVSKVAEVSVQRLAQAKMLALPAPSEDVENAELHAIARERIADVLKTLSFREREIIKLRYGFSDGNKYTLEEVGHIFGVSKDRIRQIEAIAIHKLQKPDRASMLVDLLPS